MDAVNILSLLTSLWSAAWMAPGPAPAPPREPTTVRQMAVGEGHTCAILSDNTLWCWGLNDVGQLGLGGISAPHPTPEPVRQVGKVNQIALAGYSSCAISISDELWCWGRIPAEMDLEQAKGKARGSPFRVPWNKGVRLVSVGEWNDRGYSCFIDVENNLLCWGDESLVTGSITSEVHPPIGPGGIIKAKAVAIDYRLACAIDLDDRLWCWGERAYLGLGTKSLEPTIVAERAKAIFTGQNGFCFEDVDNKVHCGGAVASRQLSVCNDWDEVVPADFTALRINHDLACFADGVGQLRCKGNGTAGSFGDPKIDYADKLTHVRTDLSVVQLAQGTGYQMCAVFSNGLSRCWGDNTYGQLGHGTAVGDTFGNHEGDDINDLPFHEFWPRDDDSKGGP